MNQLTLSKLKIHAVGVSGRYRCHYATKSCGCDCPSIEWPPGAHGSQLRVGLRVGYNCNHGFIEDTFITEIEWLD